MEIWKEVLEIKEEIGIRDDFFELGGHSIRAIKILARVSKEFGVTISIQKMFENPTIESIANKILNAGWLMEELKAPESQGAEFEETTI